MIGGWHGVDIFKFGWGKMARHGRDWSTGRWGMTMSASEGVCICGKGREGWLDAGKARADGKRV